MSLIFILCLVRFIDYLLLPSDRERSCGRHPARGQVHAPEQDERQGGVQAGWWRTTNRKEILVGLFLPSNN
jgi:hypothetical protein